jgi:hypothetical protein
MCHDPGADARPRCGMSAMAAAFMPQALSGFSRVLQPRREYGGQLLAHWRGLTMLPGGTPASFSVR